MYSTCLHCQTSLGRNDAIEAFPVSRRIAFDAEKGRLWAICSRCERWNLAPFDQRWEAIEQCERAFRGTRVRVSTDNIGLARLRDGTELVRVGKPLRPEFAAWRYGDQFGRRRKRAVTFGIAAVGAAGLGVAGLANAGLGMLGVMMGVHLVTILSAAVTAGTEGKPIHDPEGGWFIPFGTPRLIERPDVAEGWGLAVDYTQKLDSEEMPSRFGFGRANKNIVLGQMLLRGNHSTDLLRRVMPRVNRGGASRRHVQEGVALIEEAGDVENFGKWAASQRRKWGAMQTMGDTGSLNYIPAAARLAFEMAVFENDERRALLGELSQLEQAWADAERIARIADSLALSSGVERKFEALKRSSQRSSR